MDDLPKCEQCGSPCKKEGRRFCGRSCSNKWQHANGKRKPRFPNLIEAWTKKYGREEALRRESERNAKHSKSISGEQNPFFGRDHSPEFKAKSSAVHRGKKIDQNIRRKMSQAHSARIAAGIGYNPKAVRSKHGIFTSKDGREFQYASSYELRRMQFLDSNSSVQSWTRSHDIVIEYEIDGKFRSYSPDLLVVTDEGTFVEEIKGWIRDERVHAAKFEAAVKFCNGRGWSYRVLFKESLEMP